MKKIILIKKLGTFTLMFMLFGTFAKATVHNLTITTTDTVIYHFLQDTSGYDHGDTIMLTMEGTYVESKSLDIFKSMTIMTDPSLTGKPVINFHSGGFRFKAEDVDLILKGLKVSGIKPDNTHMNSELITLNQTVDDNTIDTVKSIRIIDCEIYGIQKGLKMGQFINTIIDTLIIDNVLWYNRDASSKTPTINFGEKGTAKYMSVTNSTFYNCGGSFMDSPLFEGKSGDGSGRVGEMVAKKFIIDHNTFYNILTENGSFLALHAVNDNSVDLTVSNNIVSTILDPTKSVRVFRMNADAGQVKLINNCFYDFTPSEDKSYYGYDSLVNYANVTLTSNVFIDPGFHNPSVGIFFISDTSDLTTAGTDGGIIGDTEWEPVAGISIFDVTERIIPNRTVQLTAILNIGTAADRTIAWSVKNGTGSASINTTGLVTPLSVGNVEIIAASNYDNNIKDTLELTIDPQIYVDSFSISTIDGWEQDPRSYISVDSGSLEIYVSVFPLDADVKTFTITLSDDTKAELSPDNSEISARVNGEVWIIVTADDNNATKDSVKITITNQTGVAPNAVNNTSLPSFSIVPNPAFDMFYLNSSQVAEITIINLLGKTELQTIVEENGSVKINHLKPGLYLVNIKAGEHRRTIKLLKQ